MKVLAHAKINIGLHIVGTRPDGFHNIETVFHRINLFDEINIENSDDISISSSNASIPTDSNNLCWKAVDFVKKELGIDAGARIDIKKNIPVGAGLGGGSSDAAAILRCLPQLWGKNIDQTLLESIGLRIGSDVPFFLKDTSAYAEGRGELLRPIALTIPQWIVLVNPNIHISTPWAYKRLAEKRNGTFPFRPKMIDLFNASPRQAILTADNDFEEIVFEEHLKIKKIKMQLQELGAVLALMSGSGSSMFGLFDDMISALKAVEFFNKEHFVHLTEPYFTLR
ncbi:MAG: 4-(cytidine 5'-diphospho)-2-C-methyl-D-erythritol kinase [Bacteroidota bacterium]